MTADVACGAAWLLQVQVEGAPSCKWLGLRDEATGDKGGIQRGCLTPAATVGRDL
jgi:hypothetical protein